MHKELGSLQRTVDLTDHVFKIFKIPFIGTEHPFPVPLVHVDRVDRVDIVIRAEGIHVCVDAEAWLYAVIGKCHPLPLG